jgi:anti-sigma regulatory factor (Ser/Thr protein kinase)
MRSGAAAGHRGFFHEAALYSSDEELLDVTVPFLEGGIAAGEPTVAVLTPEHEKLFRSAMDLSKLTVVPAVDEYPRPAVALRRYRELIGSMVDGAEQVRVVGHVPHPGTGEPWDWWARYEALINKVFAGFPLWGLCSYDTRITPDAVLDDVHRTHPYLLTAERGHAVNGGFEEPHRFPASWRDAPRPEPEPGAPFFELTGATAAEARQAVRMAAAQTDLDRARCEDFVMAVSEIVTNGSVHGCSPVRLRLWRTADRLVATVTDRGTGPADPFAGLIATEDSRTAGLGLWIAFQVCRHVALYRDDEGFVVRLVC